MKLILTEAEKKANTWLELDDESVGKVVKSLALHTVQFSKETDRITLYSAALVIIGNCAEINAEIFKQTIAGLTIKGESFGDWELTVKRIK